MLLTIKFGANVPIGKDYLFILLENLVLLIFVGAVEFTMFQLVEIKYEPIKPSTMINNLIDDLKKVF